MSHNLAFATDSQKMALLSRGFRTNFQIPIPARLPALLWYLIELAEAICRIAYQISFGLLTDPSFLWRSVEQVVQNG